MTEKPSYEDLERKACTPLRVIAAGPPIMVDGVLAGVVAVYTDITERVLFNPCPE